ncbi:Cytochrome c, mono- and diheme variants [Hahella chejuensis KCTC 2396]|uniref:Cytochrome c, mono-and diheme variants n=1 Tax=Hahella chejuensis (strain KCTC 2396) TaxID=349521 RepID=Q2S8A0_HAHCH|nr:cytochrome c [Hahella chejuensis]ABC33124.1 Cytochrome c, mono- and diheme variants [Hahella chejuensis KCTC 2396]
MNKSFLPIILGVLLATLHSLSYARGEVGFTIRAGDKEAHWSKSQLLNHSARQVLNIPLLNYPDQNFSINAVPISVLLQDMDLTDASVLIFTCLDGYSGVLEKKYLLNDDPDASRAYLAIEPDEKKWPPLPKDANTSKQSAGPFYLVWSNPEKSDIPPEFWPYQLSSLDVEDDFARIFPALLPAGHLAANDPARKGFQVYKARCMHCHQINGQGAAKLGPDLNQPMNPTEYFNEAALKQFIKDPTSVRKWSDMKMVWVKDDIWKDEEIDDLIAYLKHMAERKPDMKQASN